MKKFIYSLAIIAGTAIGVGIFGVPYAAGQVGFLPALGLFLFLGAITTLMQLIYGEICLRSNEFHRMPGYAKMYFGKKAKSVILISNMIGLYGAILAYLIIGGNFLARLLSPFFGGPEIIYLLIFFASGALIIFFGSKAIAKSEILSLIIFFAVLVFLYYKGWNFIKVENLLTIDWYNIFYPYGVILFAISGISVIPEAREILAEKANHLKVVILLGTFIPVFTTLLFALLILGISGTQTTQDALTGLSIALGGGIIAAGMLFGVIATFTSYLTIGLTLKKIYFYDLKFPIFNAWVMATFVPLMLYFLGLQNFITIISFSAALGALVEGTLLYMIYLKAKTAGQRVPEYELKLPQWGMYPLVGLFAVGVVATIITVL